MGIERSFENTKNERVQCSACSNRIVLSLKIRNIELDYHRYIVSKQVFYLCKLCIRIHGVIYQERAVPIKIDGEWYEVAGKVLINLPSNQLSGHKLLLPLSTYQEMLNTTL